MVWGPNPCGGKIFHTCPDQPWSPPSPLYNKHQVSFPGIRQPGCGTDHPPPSSNKVKRRVKLYFYSPFAPSWLVIESELHLLQSDSRLTFCRTLLSPSSGQKIVETTSGMVQKTIKIPDWWESHLRTWSVSSISFVKDCSKKLPKGIVPVSMRNC